MKVVIVGGVAGGAGAAARMRRNDENARIVLLERGGYISFANCGLPYYLGGVIKERDKLLLQTPASFRTRFQVDVRIHNEVLRIDPDRKSVTVRNLISGKTYEEPYDALILSPGARPIVPNVPGVGRPGVFTLRSIEDTDHIQSFLQKNNPKTAAIIGAGAIGIEMAENLLRRELKVSLIDAAPHVIGQLDMDLAGEVSAYLEEQGITLFTGIPLKEIGDSSVHLSDGRKIPADMVLVCIGVRPDTKFLVGSGIALGDRGEILVDSSLRTNLSGVYAVGDAVSAARFGDGKRVVTPLASPANKQARIAADQVCGKTARYHGALGTAIIKCFGMTVAMTGDGEDALQRLGIPYRAVLCYSPSNASYYPEHSYMTIKLLFAPDSGKLLGAQIVGYSGVDKRIDVLATAIRAGLNVFDLAELELSYAPPYSSAKDPVNMAGYIAQNLLTGMSDPFYVHDLDSLREDGVLLDVRTDEEFKAGTLKGAINIPLDELRSNLGRLDQEKTCYVFCRIGQRGYIAERILKQHGYRVKNLIGGYLFCQKQSKGK